LSALSLQEFDRRPAEFARSFEERSLHRVALLRENQPIRKMATDIKVGGAMYSQNVMNFRTDP
jgi:hypothetical protein